MKRMGDRRKRLLIRFIWFYPLLTDLLRQTASGLPKELCQVSQSQKNRFVGFYGVFNPQNLLGRLLARKAAGKRVQCPFRSTTISLRVISTFV
jgi:hypothetical protein